MRSAVHDYVFGAETRRGDELRALRAKIRELYEKGVRGRALTSAINTEGFRTMKRKCFTAAQVSTMVYQMKRERILR